MSGHKTNIYNTC